ncbi:MAG: DUF4168 domain-containing protein [Nodosilinea sp.]
MSTITIGDLVSGRLGESVVGYTVMGFEWMAIAAGALLPRLIRNLRLVLPLTLVGGLLLSMPAPALGATTATAAPMAEAVAPPAPAQPDANDIPSDTVSRFVKAYIAVVKLIESRELGLQRAETDTESSQMQQEIQAAALDLIQANDLTLSDYWELLGLANSDPEFRDRVLAQIDEASP